MRKHTYFSVFNSLFAKNLQKFLSYTVSYSLKLSLLALRTAFKHSPNGVLKSLLELKTKKYHTITMSRTTIFLVWQPCHSSVMVLWLSGWQPCHYPEMVLCLFRAISLGLSYYKVLQEKHKWRIIFGK